MGRASAEAVRAALRDHFKGGAHVILEQVRNQTGSGRTERYADALVASVWPSRGLWFAGIEIKVDRADWIRELQDPEKSAAIQQYCHYWWIAAAEGIVQPDELPETWGLFELHGKKLKLTKQAPRLKPKALAAKFVCSVLRNAAKAQEARLSEIRWAAERVAEEKYGGDGLRQLERDKISLELKCSGLERHNKHLQEDSNKLRELKQVLSPHSRRLDLDEVKRRVEAAAAIEADSLKPLAQKLRHAAKLVDAVADGQVGK